eukprot:m.123732 g.123732  ORF g.123732 m.123732 type:complete len:952 (+) comp9415_c1_seq4:48-2903(+)
MGGHDKKTGKGRLDKYYKLAKGTGYRARSAFKLIQLNQKFHFLEGATICIDLCAAPGGWMQVAKKFMKASASMVIGVDLVPIAPISGCIGIQSDITTEHCRQELKKNMQQAKADCVLHDGAPNVGTAWLQDAFTQSDLVLKSLKLATEFLKEDGVFVSKVFRSRDTWKLMYVFKQLFKTVKATKPDSSRGVSAEIFVVCQGYLAPHHIDPKLLDTRYVFGDVAEDKKPIDVFNQKVGKKAKAEGYEEGDYLLRKEVAVEEFINSSNFLEMLAEYTRFNFSSSSILLKLPETTEEIKALCNDLRVLNKKDFKNLVKWRAKVRKFLEVVEKERKVQNGESEEEQNDGSDDAEEKKGTEDADGDLDGELKRAIADAEAAEKSKKKREKRKREKLNAKLREKISLQLDAPSLETSIDNHDLFNLGTINSKKKIDLVEGTALMEGIHGVPPKRTDKKSNEGDSESEDEDYMDMVEAQLEDQYGNYLERKNIKVRRVKFAGKSTLVMGKITNGSSEIISERSTALKHSEIEHAKAELEQERKGSKGKKNKSKLVEDDDVDEDMFDDNGGNGGLLRTRMDDKSATSRWFSSQGIGDVDIMDDIDIGDDSDEEEEEKKKKGEDMKEESTKESTKKLKKSNNGKKEEDDNDEPIDDATKEEMLSRVEKGKDDQWAKKLGLKIHKADLIDSDVEDAESDSGEDSDDDRGVITKSKKPKKKTTDAEEWGEDDEDDEDDKKKKPKKGKLMAGQKEEKEETFEEVPADHPMKRHKGLDATGLAIATQLIVNKKKRELIDKSYHRYANEDGYLPTWFEDEESIATRKMQPVTKAMVEEIRARERELNAKPIKKVLEAKARERNKTEKYMSRINQKVSSIADSGSLTEFEKVKNIESLYKQVRLKRNKHDRMHLVVSSRAGASKRANRPDGVKGKYLLVDKRLLADKRGEKLALKKKKKRAKHRGK